MTISLGYDANSRLLTYTDDGGTVTYGYDTTGTLTSIAEPGGDCTGASIFNPPPASALCTLFALDRDGNRVTTIYPGNVAELDRTYNNAGQIIETRATGVVGGVRSDLLSDTYSYTDSAGNATVHISKRTEADPNRVVSFTYSNTSRLSYYEGDDRTTGAYQDSTRYCYDPAANITSIADHDPAPCPASTSFTIDGANQILSSTTSGQPTRNFSYDANGANTGWSYSDSSPGTSYTYNDRGQLTGITSAGNNPVTLTYAGATNNQLVQVASGSVTKGLGTGPLGLSEITTDTGTGPTTDYITRDPAGQLISYRPATGTHQYYLTGLESSQTPSVQGVIDADGTHTAFYHYGPYGGLSDNSDTTSPAGPFRFLGHVDLNTLDPAIHTGSLIHLGARYLDPHLARFTQTDPVTHLTNPNTANPYTYAGADPINHADPYGQSILDELAGAVEDTLVDPVSGLVSSAEQVVPVATGCIGGAEAGATAISTAGVYIAAAGPEAETAAFASATVGGCLLGLSPLGSGL